MPSFAFFLRIFGLLALICLSQCHIGFMIQEYDADSLNYFKKMGFQLGVVDANYFDGSQDPEVVDNLKAVAAAGFQADLLLLLCPFAQTATQFVNKIMDGIPSNLYGMIWLLIEDTQEGCEWKDRTSNCAYILELVSAIKKRGKRAGVYAVPDNWLDIVGDSAACEVMGNEPLMYLGLDNQTNFNNFQPFGPWKKPTMKVYRATFYVEYIYYK